MTDSDSAPAIIIQNDTGGLSEADGEVVLDRAVFLQQQEARMNASSNEQDDEMPFHHHAVRHAMIMRRTRRARHGRNRRLASRRVAAHHLGGSGNHINTSVNLLPDYKYVPSASKSIHMLKNANPPEWPSRLGTIDFISTVDLTMKPNPKGGLSETDASGSPINTSATYGNAPLQTKIQSSIPFNTQLEDIRFIGHNGAWSDMVRNFDRLIFGRDSEKAAGISLGKADVKANVDFAVNWEVNMLGFGESIPIMAKHAYIGFGQDGTDVILDLGVALYTCDPFRKGPECQYRGMLNWETEGNHPHMAFEKAWPESPMQMPRKGLRRKNRCTDSYHMCAGSKEYSGFFF
eukprot:gnl/MRDRNA2_/MRDRNA2_151695_c0_seq1.p1 gnl/MRDRNA2_/MRDRNA2_151695_c0~~gnl/MRDRNA2_/MRDRNA2_151695_c0_seq1.p1  ORF type:complete len:407 (+),score=50.60 gnl/MRDRNA2_/MRDRNA2_151695_c0_seq1:183-1223(+)